MSYKSNRDNIQHFCMRLPFAIQDWLGDKPPSIADDYLVDILIALAQCLSEEDAFEVESLVDTFHDYIVEEFRVIEPSFEPEDLWSYETFFADLYMMAQTLCAQWELAFHPKDHILRRCRLTTGAVRKDIGLVMLTVDERANSLYYDGEFDYLRLGVET